LFLFVKKKEEEEQRQRERERKRKKSKRYFSFIYFVFFRDDTLKGIKKRKRNTNNIENKMRIKKKEKMLQSIEKRIVIRVTACIFHLSIFGNKKKTV
jgi:hypothetical protein